MNATHWRALIVRAAISFGIVLLLGALPATVATPAGADDHSTLSLRTHVTVDGPTVRLADIFDGFDGARVGVDGETVVGYAPQPGRRAIFDATWLSRLAQRYRLGWRPTSRLDRVTVERTSTIVTAEQIVAALRDELAARGSAENFDVQLSNRNLLVHIDNSEPATVEVVNIAMDARSKRFSAIVAIPAGDPQARRITVVGQIFPMVEVPVPAQDLRPGSIVQPSDVTWRRIRAAHIRNDNVTAPDELIGRQARRPLAANTPVRATDLRAPVTVAKGALVTMIFRTPAMLLTANGRALGAGSTGDFISVRNTQTQKTVDARILGPNRVEVAATRQPSTAQGERQ